MSENTAGRVLLISGSTRAGSTNTALLRTAEAIAPNAVRYQGMTTLPHFNPDDDVDGALPEPVVELRAAIDSAVAVLFCTPEYASALPGSFKNLLDWTVGGGEIYGKAVAYVNVSPHGAVDAHDSLVKVLAKIGTKLISEACQPIPVTRDQVGDDGLIHDPEVRTRLAAALDVLAAQ